MGLEQLMEKIFGKGLAKKAQEYSDPAGVNTIATTPTILPKSTSVDLGEKTGAVLPTPKPIPPVPTTPTGVPFAYRPPAPVETAAAAPDLSLTPKAPVQPVNPGTFFNQGQPYRDLRGEARFREQFGRDAGADMSERQYADPYTQAKFDKVYGEPMAQGKTVHDLEHPGAGGRLKLALKGALLGMANNPTGDVGGLIGGALGGAAGSAINPAGAREWQYDMGEGRQVAAQIGREQEQQGARAKLAEIFARIGAQQSQAQRNTAQGRAATDKTRLEREQWEYEQQHPKPIPIGAGGSIDLRTGQRIDPYQKPVQPKLDDSGEYLMIIDDKGVRPYLDEKGNRVLSRSVLTGREAIQSREKIAGQASRDRRDIAAAYEGGRNARHEGGGGQTGSGANLYQKWATLRKKAMNEDGRLTQQEVDAAVMQMNEAAEKLRNDPSFKVGGEGGWSWVEPVKGSSGATGGGGRTVALSQLKAHGLTEEAAKAAGYTVDRNR